MHLAFHNCCWINSYLWSYENSQYCAWKLVFPWCLCRSIFWWSVAQWRNASLPSFFGYVHYFYFIGILFGAIIERGILKRMYDKDEIVLVLVTYVFSLF